MEQNHRHHHNHTHTHTHNPSSPQFKNGDVVWAKSRSSKWSPALILDTKLNPNDPVPIFSLSFFDNKFPRYRFKTDLRSFEDHFLHFIKHLTCTITTTTTNTSMPVLDRALKYIVEREELDLRCRCLVNSGDDEGGYSFGKKEEREKGLVLGFRMEEVLGYIRGVAVEGFVEGVEFVGAVRMPARVRVIRKFFEIREREFWREVRRKRRIRNSQMAGWQSKLYDYGQQETEWRVLSDETADCSMNSAAGANNLTFNGIIIQRSILVDQISKKGRISIEQNKTLSFPLMLENLHCLALDMFYLPSDCLDSFMANFLRLRAWICQNSRNYWKYRCCSYENIKAPFSCDEKSGIQLTDHNDKQRQSQEIVNAIAPSMKSIPCLETKEQHLLMLGSPIVLKPMPSIFSIIRDVIIFQRNQLTTEAEVSDDQSSSFYPRDPFFRLHSSTSLCCKKDLAFPKLKNSYKSLFLHKSCRSEAFGITQISDATHEADVDSDEEISVSFTNAQECQEDGSIPPDQWSCASYNLHCAEGVNGGAAAAGLKGLRVVTLPPQALAFHDDVHNSESSKGCKMSNYSEVGEINTLPTGTPGMTTSKIIHEVCQSLSTESNENKKFCRDINPDTLAMSQATHQLEARQTWLFPTSLHMKFPRGCSLPSKKDLVKKFSRFGPINAPRTRVFLYTSAAQVVFLHKVDAVAAYHYAKRRKVFSSLENVRFWLDSNENVRNGSNPSFINSQKSRLKRSRHLEQESKRPPKKVRFLMET